MESVLSGLTRALTGLGVVSVVAGGVLARRGATEEQRAFGQQTAAWGAVNLAIAGVSRLRPAPGPERLRRVLLINAGLDVGYVAAGAHIAFWRTTFGERLTPGQARGHGLAVTLQGLALLTLDTTYARRLSS